MLKRISKRFIPLIAVVALVLNLAVVPQRARAVGITATAIAAASAAAILTACGVSYWASSQTDAIDYISGKLEDYLTSIEVSETPAEWLEIAAESQPFTVITGGAMQFTSTIANKLLDFCRWFQTEEGLESGGDAVGDYSLPNGYNVIYTNENRFTGTWNAKIIETNKVLVTMDDFDKGTYIGNVAMQIEVPARTGENTVINIISSNITTQQGESANGYVHVSVNGSNTYSCAAGVTIGQRNSSDIAVIKFNTSNLSGYVLSGYYTFTIQSGVDISLEKYATVTPTDFVNVPAPLDLDGTFTLIPSVQLAEGDSVDTAAEAILDGITSEDGLSSTVEETPGTSWGWLYTLLANIASTIGAGVSDIKDKLDGVKGSADDAASAAQGAATASQGAASAAQDAATAAQGVETAVEGLQSTAEGIEDNTATIARNLAPATYGDVADYQLDLTSLFPFCIPRDIYTAISLFASEPEAPSIDWDMPLPNGSTYHIEYDLSQWDNIASLLRHLELLLYGVGLMMATKSIIKW